VRTVGALVTGMFGGLLLGLVLVEPVARLVVDPGGDVTPGAALLLGLGPPGLALLGAAAGVLVERRSRGRAR
jgi:hypothetical protein